MKRTIGAMVAVAAATAAAATATGCSGLADPKEEPIARSSGAVLGALPPNTRVALVWRASVRGAVTFVTAGDAPVIGDRFDLPLYAPPPAETFAPLERGASIGADSDAPLPGYPGPAGGAGGAGAPGRDPGVVDNGTPLPPPPVVADASVRPQGGVGGTVTFPLAYALAGFAVYEDRNGNGKLDLDGSRPASRVDTIIGSTDEAVVVYLRGGTDADLARLEDDYGQGAHRGYGVLSRQGKGGRWLLPTQGVQLVVTPTPRMARAVCGDAGAAIIVEPVGPRGTDESGGEPAPGVSYPPPGAPGLVCARNGRAFVYAACDAGTSAANPSTPGDLCNSDGSPNVTRTCPGVRTELYPGQPVPVGWPCVAAIDDGPSGGSGAGGARDDGTYDGGAAGGDDDASWDGGPFDAGPWRDASLAHDAGPWRHASSSHDAGPLYDAGTTLDAESDVEPTPYAP